MPTSAGSMRVLEYRIGRLAFRLGTSAREATRPSGADAPFTSAASCPARSADRAATSTAPPAQTARSASAIGPGRASDATGSAMRSNDAGHAKTAGIGPCDAGASRSPSAVRSENGTRNLTDAASQSPYRIRAESSFSTRTTSATATANSVDCQRWFTKLAIIALLLLVGLAGLLERAARFLDVVQRQPSRLDQVGDQRLRAAAEEAEELVDDRAPCGVGRDQRLEDVCIADLLRAADGALRFEPIHDCLHRRISRPALRREVLLDLAHRRRAELRERVEDLELEAAQLRRRRFLFTTHVGESTMTVYRAQGRASPSLSRPARL